MAKTAVLGTINQNSGGPIFMIKLSLIKMSGVFCQAKNNLPENSLSISKLFTAVPDSAAVF